MVTPRGLQDLRQDKKIPHCHKTSVAQRLERWRVVCTSKVGLVELNFEGELQ
jgi:hypothetical protein